MAPVLDSGLVNGKSLSLDFAKLARVLVNFCK